MRKKDQKGQIALVLVLIMTVVSGLVVSLATKSVVQTSTTSNQLSSIDASLLSESSLRWESFDPIKGTIEAKDPVNVRSFNNVKSDESIKLELSSSLSAPIAVPICWSPYNLGGLFGKLMISVYTDTGVFDYYYTSNQAETSLIYAPLSGPLCTGIGERSISLSLPVGTTSVIVNIFVSDSDLLIDPDELALPSSMIKNIAVGAVSGAYSGIVEVASDSVRWPNVFSFAVFSGGSVSSVALSGSITPTTTTSLTPTPSVSRTITGGTYTESGGYGIHTFNVSGSFTSNVPLVVDLLVVGGGGGAGYENSDALRGGGGGGAGGVIYIPSYSLNSGTYTVTIGAGGAGSTVSTTKGGNGNNSVFGTLTALGGGGGGSRDNRQGENGGSGGGAGRLDGFAGNTSTGLGLQPSQSGDSGIYGYGNRGFANSNDQGGGGGAGSVGGPYSNMCQGGLGMTVNGVVYATGGSCNSNGADGAANTGNGGNSKGFTCNGCGGGAGGSGVVIVRYPL